MTRETLGQEDWLAAGFRGLAKLGPAGIQINALAKELGATKGSFYWHFKDIGDFRSKMLALWREKVATEIIAEVETASTAESRFDMLWKAAMKPAPELFGGRKIETAMRAWALADSQVGDALALIDKQRRDFIARLLRDMGLADPHLPDLLYAAYIGLDDLSSRGRVEMEEAFKTMRGLLSRNLD